MIYYYQCFEGKKRAEGKKTNKHFFVIEPWFWDLYNILDKKFSIEEVIFTINELENGNEEGNREIIKAYKENEFEKKRGFIYHIFDKDNLCIISSTLKGYALVDELISTTNNLFFEIDYPYLKGYYAVLMGIIRFFDIETIYESFGIKNKQILKDFGWFLNKKYKGTNIIKKEKMHYKKVYVETLGLIREKFGEVKNMLMASNELFFEKIKV